VVVVEVVVVDVVVEVVEVVEVVDDVVVDVVDEVGTVVAPDTVVVVEGDGILPETPPHVHNLVVALSPQVATHVEVKRLLLPGK
jgi:hypothetical protein